MAASEKLYEGTTYCSDCISLRAVKNCKEEICPNPNKINICKSCICGESKFKKSVVKKNSHHFCNKHKK